MLFSILPYCINCQTEFYDCFPSDTHHIQEGKNLQGLMNFCGKIMPYLPYVTLVPKNITPWWHYIDWFPWLWWSWISE